MSTKLSNENVKAIREARRVSQRYFADHVGVTQGTVASWEAGRSPVPRWFEKHWGVILGKLDGELAPTEDARLRKKITEKLDRERLEAQLRKERRQPRQPQRTSKVDIFDNRSRPGPDGLTLAERGRRWIRADGVVAEWVWEVPEDGMSPSDMG